MRTCIYDNPSTHHREFWKDGAMVGEVPKTMFRDWIPNVINGDPAAKGRAVPYIDISGLPLLGTEDELRLYTTMGALLSVHQWAGSTVGRKALMRETLEWHFAFGRQEAIEALKVALDDNFTDEEIEKILEQFKK